VSPEAAAIYYVTVEGWSAPGVATLAAIGQAVAAVVLFYAGGQLRKRWAWFDRKCEAARAKMGSHLARGHWALAAFSGLLGLPPMSVTSALAPGLGVPFRLFLPVVFLARVVRFVVVTTVVVRIRAALAGH
jgi:membrane protein YqaA with SNARE-associated domain